MDGISFSSTFKNSSDRELMSSDLYNNQHHHPSYQQQQQSSGLVKYRSAPSSFFSSILDGTDCGGGGGGGGGVDGCEEYLNPQTSSPETETIFSRFVSGNGSGESDLPDLLQYPTAMKHEMDVSSPMVYNTANQNSVGSGVSMEGSFRVMNSMAMENMNQVRTSNENCSNLVRQSSSPAGFLANLNVENGFSVTREGRNLRTSNRANVDSRLNNHTKSSSGPATCSRFNPQISGNGNGVGRGSPESGLLGNTNDTNRCYLPSIPNNSWNESTFTSLKRNRDGDLKMFSSLNGLDTENGDSRHYTAGLTHHLSLPKTTAEMAAVEKYLQFQQDAIPCKIRAKRGFATHPRSIAERVRRTRISERMRKLQELFPNMDKQANTADMLDLAVEFIKDLQKEVQTLTDAQSRCTCSSKQKQSSPNE